MEQIIVLTRFRKTLLLHQICLQSQCNSSSTPALLLNLHETALQDILIHVIFDIIAIYNIFYMQYIFIYNMYYLVVYLETCPPIWLLMSHLHSQLAKKQMFSKLSHEFQPTFPKTELY